VTSALAAYSEEWSNPFPGLRPFEPDEDYLFFGRERQTDDLLKRLRTTRFLSILGTSGSGKSSLVRSGLIPSLYGGGMTVAGSRWRMAIMRPGDDPIGNLAAALSASEALGAQSDEEGMTRSFFETTLRSSNLGLIECVQQARIAPRDNVLVLIDQFEELFRYKRSRRAAGRDDALAFVKLLLAARGSEAPLYIALTMRSDFIGDCMEFGGLPEVINDGVYLVSRMTRDELRLAITGPVAVGGAAIAPRLVSRLLNDVGDDPDQLPILQHALMRTWERWRAEHQPGEPLDLRHYEAIGTMQTALSRHAEEAFAELNGNEQVIAEKLFKALTDKETDLRGVRRPAAMAEICALTGASLGEVAAVIDHFRENGRTFLMPPAGAALDDDSIIDISHESLMRVWTRLSDWADNEAKSAQLYLDLARAAAHHEAGVAALWRDPELQLALTWRDAAKPTAAWAARYDASFDRAMAFLDASKAERDREIHEKETRRRVLVTILIAASTIIAAFGVYAFKQKTQAERAEKVAIGAQHRAEVAVIRVKKEQARADSEKKRAEEQAFVAREQKTEADQQRTNADVERATALKQKALAEKQTSIAQQQTTIATGERVKATEAQQVAMKSAQDALDQKKKADEARNEAIKLSHREEAHALALKVIAQTAWSDSSAHDALAAERLNRENGGRIEDPDIFKAMLLTLQGNRLYSWQGSDSFRSLVIAPDGRTAFAGCDDGSLFTFDITRDDVPKKLGKLPLGVRALAARGNLLAIGMADGRISLRDLHDPAKTIRDLEGGSDVISALAFQPNGPLLAAGSFDGLVRVWNTSDTSPPQKKISPAGESVRINAVAFDAGGTSLAIGTSQGAFVVRTADLTGGTEPVCEGDVRSVAIGAGKLACGLSDGKILEVGLHGSKTPQRLEGHASSVNSLRYNARGDILLSGSSDGTVRLWDRQAGNVPPIVLSGHESWVWAAVFASNEERVLSAGKDVRLWPAKTKVLAGDLCAVVGGGDKDLCETVKH
jgi:hypothetical protein